MSNQQTEQETTYIPENQALDEVKKSSTNGTLLGAGGYTTIVGFFPALHLLFTSSIASGLAGLGLTALTSVGSFIWGRKKGIQEGEQKLNEKSFLRLYDGVIDPAYEEADVTEKLTEAKVKEAKKVAFDQAFDSSRSTMLPAWLPVIGLTLFVASQTAPKEDTTESTPPAQDTEQQQESPAEESTQPTDTLTSIWPEKETNKAFEPHPYNQRQIAIPEPVSMTYALS